MYKNILIMLIFVGIIFVVIDLVKTEKVLEFKWPSGTAADSLPLCNEVFFRAVSSETLFGTRG